MSRTAAASRPGMALVVALVTLVVLALAAAAAVLAAGMALTGAAERADALRARTLAASAARAAALDPWPEARRLPLAAATPARTVVADGPDTARAAARRLATGWLVVEGDGRARAARARAAVLLRILETRDLLPAFPGALAGPAVHLAATAVASAAGAAAPPAGWPDAWCTGAGDSVAAALGSAAWPGVAVPAADALQLDAGATLEGSPPAAFVPALAAPPAGLGPLDWIAIARVADRVETAPVRIGPALSGAECARTAPGNWGDPDDPGSPCARYFPLVFAPGDLRVDGGAGQGVLVVAGNLVLGSGSRFVGPILVGGAVAGESGATVDGALRAGGPIDWAGSARFRACPIVRALEEAPGLARPFRAPGRWWLPAF